jgi:hypothetical protein
LGESPSAAVIKATDFHTSALSRTVKISKNRIKKYLLKILRQRDCKTLHGDVLVTKGIAVTAGIA